MAKIIRPTYPKEFSIGLLLLVFVLSGFLSIEIFDVHWSDLKEGVGPFPGMALAGLSVVIMALILWEEFLFPVRINPSDDQIIFRNHFTKLKTQVLIYCMIPAIVIFNFLAYEVSYVPFFIWAGLCVLSPAGKLISGVKNYNDFLRLTNEAISYKNNDKEGILPVSQINGIVLVKDENNVLHKVQLKMFQGSEIIIDLDEMELEAYYQTIEKFIKGHYGKLVN